MAKFEIYDSQGERYEVEAWDLQDALNGLGVDIWNGSAGECGQEFDLWHDGIVYTVQIDFDPTAWARKVERIDAPEPPEAHVCGWPQGEHCPDCWKHDYRVKGSQRVANKYQEFELMLQQMEADQ